MGCFFRYLEQKKRIEESMIKDVGSIISIILIVLFVFFLVYMFLNIFTLDETVSDSYEVIDSWIEVDYKIRYDKDWKIIEKVKISRFYVKIFNIKEGEKLLSVSSSDFYSLIKKKNFIYTYTKKVSLLQHFLLKK